MNRREFIASAAVLTSPLAGMVNSGLSQIPLFVSGQDGYHTYRIPALITTPGGLLLAFVEGRKNSRRDHGDIDLLVKRSADNGRTWSNQRVVYEEGGNVEITMGNPCPVIDHETGTLWLPFCRDNLDVLITKTTDEGYTWSKPTVITSEVKKPLWTWYATGPGVGIQLKRGQHKGRLVIPCDHSEPVDGIEKRFSHVFYSDDHGTQWQLGGSSDVWTNECQVVELMDGSLLLNMRNQLGRDGGQPDLGGRRAIAVSRDGGTTWSPRQFDETLIEPVCQASLITYSVRPNERNRLLFSNPASSTKRERMTVRLSYDEGKTWPVEKILCPGPSAYSSLCRLSDGSVGCLYERRDPAETIVFASFSLSWLTDGREGV